MHGCNLVIVGNRGWGTDDLRELLMLTIFRNKFTFSKTFQTSICEALYSGALFSVYPSLYEGFGLPIIEAMACGCPVVTSSVSSMPEVAGDAAFYVDPASTESIKSALRQMINGNDLRGDLAQKGMARRRAFSWI